MMVKCAFVCLVAMVMSTEAKFFKKHLFFQPSLVPIPVVAAPPPPAIYQQPIVQPVVQPVVESYEVPEPAVDLYSVLNAWKQKVLYENPVAKLIQYVKSKPIVAPSYSLVPTLGFTKYQKIKYLPIVPQVVNVPPHTYGPPPPPKTAYGPPAPYSGSGSFPPPSPGVEVI